MGSILLGQFANGDVKVYADYLDTGNKPVVGIRCNNPSGSDLRATISRQTTGLVDCQGTFIRGLSLQLGLLRGGLNMVVGPEGDLEIPYVVNLEYPPG